MTERRFFPPRRDRQTSAEWHQTVEFLARHQLDPNNIPAGEQIIWDDGELTITVMEWQRNANGNLQFDRGIGPLMRPVILHTDWSELPKPWQEVAL